MSKKAKNKQPTFAKVVGALGERRPATVRDPDIRKVASAAVSTTWNDECPSWRVAQLELVDPYGWHDLTAAKLLDIRSHLASFETMTWNEISVKAKYFHHTIPVHEIDRAAQKRLNEIGFGYLDELFRFRLGNLGRVWGFRDRSVMHVLWWDPDHQICKSVP